MTSLAVTTGQGAGAAGGRSWFNEHILLGLGARGYLRSLVTPFNAIAVVLCSIGLPVLTCRRRSPGGSGSAST